MHHCIIVVTSKNNESPIGLQFDRSYLSKRIMEFFRWSTLVVFFVSFFIFWRIIVDKLPQFGRATVKKIPGSDDTTVHHRFRWDISPKASLQAMN